MWKMWITMWIIFMQKKFLKNFKKVIDKVQKVWYNDK